MVSPVAWKRRLCLRGNCAARNTTPWRVIHQRKLVSTRASNFPRALTYDLRGGNTTWNPDEEIRTVTYDNLHLPRSVVVEITRKATKAERVSRISPPSRETEGHAHWFFWWRMRWVSSTFTWRHLGMCLDTRGNFSSFHLRFCGRHRRYLEIQKRNKNC